MTKTQEILNKIFKNLIKFSNQCYFGFKLLFDAKRPRIIETAINVPTSGDTTIIAIKDPIKLNAADRSQKTLPKKV